MNKGKCSRYQMVDCVATTNRLVAKLALQKQPTNMWIQKTNCSSKISGHTQQQASLHPCIAQVKSTQMGGTMDKRQFQLLFSSFKVIKSTLATFSPKN